MNTVGRKKESSRRRGFTLVEIMIVVAIVGLLSAIAIPSIAKARKRTRISTMVNDMRIIYEAFGMYAMNNGTYPAGWRDAPEPVTEYLARAKWNDRTPFGGRWLYFSAFGTHLLVVDDINVDPGQNPITTIDEWKEADSMVDDGNLSTGFFRLISNVQMQYSLDETIW